MPRIAVHPSVANDLKLDSDHLISVLSDFPFVANGDYIPSSIPAHTMNTIPLPATFDVGQQYVFHSHSEDNDRHFQQLQDALESRGFELVAADKLAYRYVGGLLFRIKFRSATKQFVLFNQLDRQILRNAELIKTWSIDDYVLTVEGRS